MCVWDLLPWRLTSSIPSLSPWKQGQWYDTLHNIWIIFCQRLYVCVWKWVCFVVFFFSFFVILSQFGHFDGLDPTPAVIGRETGFTWAGHQPITKRTWRGRQPFKHSHTRSGQVRVTDQPDEHVFGVVFLHTREEHANATQFLLWGNSANHRAACVIRCEAKSLWPK